MAQRAVEEALTETETERAELQPLLERVVPRVLNELNITEITKDVAKLIKILKCQSQFNSPLFVSHGMDHSFRVAEYGLQIYKQSPIFEEALERQLGEKYKETVILTCLLHDVGYIEYEYDNQNHVKNDRISECLSEFRCECAGCGINEEYFRELKFLHAKLGATWIERSLKELPNSKYIIHTVENHNSDSKGSQTRYEPSQHGKLCSLTEGYSRAYLPCSVNENPLLSLLRIADNLDITRTRLSLEQRATEFISFQRFVAQGEKYSQAEKQTVIKDILEKNPDCRPDIVKHLVERTNEHEFKFQYSNWIWESATIGYEEGPFIFTLRCETVHLVKSNPLSFTNNIEPALFQFKRMIESFKTIKVNERDEETIDKKIYVTIIVKDEDYDESSESGIYSCELAYIFDNLKHWEEASFHSLGGGRILKGKRNKIKRKKKNKSRKKKKRRKRSRKSKRI
tara:strand:+ start:97 stop:1464 length:1368 start_codon:yes stop_codon:yes gene_type:complete